MRNTAVTSCYSAKVYFLRGVMPPVSAPDSIWREWHRLMVEAGETLPFDVWLEEFGA